MSFDTIRPILSGLIGAAIFSWLATKWAKWVHATVGTKGRDRLLREHRRTIRAAHVLGFCGICSGLFCYWSGWLSRYDWRGLGLGFGLMCLLPIAYMVAANGPRGSSAIKECLVTYAISQKTPPRLLFAVMALMLAGGIVSAVSLFL